ncbi:MAG: hypothetical protein RLZZ184_3382 [Cyanobacteriota bacterium]
MIVSENRLLQDPIKLDNFSDLRARLQALQYIWVNAMMFNQIGILGGAVFQIKSISSAVS